jgi:hypothetical protein
VRRKFAVSFLSLVLVRTGKSLKTHFVQSQKLSTAFQPFPFCLSSQNVTAIPFPTLLLRLHNEFSALPRRYFCPKTATFQGTISFQFSVLLFFRFRSIFTQRFPLSFHANGSRFSILRLSGCKSKISVFLFSTACL